MANRSDVSRAQTAEATLLKKNNRDSDEIAEIDVNSLTSKPVAAQDAVVRSPRVLPPFIASHDIPRGVAYALQALLTYLLMLAVM